MKKLLSLIVILTLANNASSATSFEAKVTGAGNPIIFIPGLACNGSVWNDAVARYSDSNECHVLSIAGFAGTPAAKESDVFLKTVETDLAAYISEHALQNPTVVGHSLGGFIALQLATNHPELNPSLLIVDSLTFLPAAMNPQATVESSKVTAEAQREMMSQGVQSNDQLRMMFQMLATSPDNIERIVAMSLKSDASAVAQAMYELNTTDIRNSVSTIKAPTTILGAWYGYAQFGSTQESTAAIFHSQYANLPNYRLVMSERGKHFIMWDDPEIFYQELDQILKIQ